MVEISQNSNVKQNVLRQFKRQWNSMKQVANESYRPEGYCVNCAVRFFDQENGLLSGKNVP